MILTKLRIWISVGIFAFCGLAQANEGVPAERVKLVNNLMEREFKKWLDAPQLIQGIREQNAEHASLQQADIDAMDRQWRNERERTGNRPLIDKVFSNPLSGFLQNEIKSAKPKLYLEIFAMDNKGLNVGLSDITSDYWQGDEDKWQQTFLKGPGAVHIGEYEYDDSVEMYITQVSVSVTDPDSGTVIGAVTIGVSAWEMLRLYGEATGSGY